jgi:PTS system ascorbate-specific IIB component
MRIVAVCGLGYGTSVILKNNIEKALIAIDYEGATVEAVGVAEARQIGAMANIVMTTEELLPILEGINAEIIPIRHVIDIDEITRALEKALL